MQSCQWLLLEQRQLRAERAKMKEPGSPMTSLICWINSSWNPPYFWSFHYVRQCVSSLCKPTGYVRVCVSLAQKAFLITSHVDSTRLKSGRLSPSVVWPWKSHPTFLFTPSQTGREFFLYLLILQGDFENQWDEKSLEKPEALLTFMYQRVFLLESWTPRGFETFFY